MLRLYQGNGLRDKWGSQGRLGEQQTLSERERRGGEVGWQRLSELCSLRKLWQGFWGTLKPKLAIRGVPGIPALASRPPNHSLEAANGKYDLPLRSELCIGGLQSIMLPVVEDLGDIFS